MICPHCKGTLSPPEKEAEKFTWHNARKTRHMTIYFYIEECPNDSCAFYLKTGGRFRYKKRSQSH